ncbi:MAG: cytochrome P450 [Alteromonadaceae bacterium]|nr:cytochrome P450 [Alteromonadaceae bacterium]|tara:strand:+ start:4892 stop:6226 length:1335 start_codon:yes stop_codon:yes gene_type:complete
METTASSLPKATLAETITIATQVFGPLFAEGVIIRRPAVLRLADKLDLNRRGVDRIQELRNKYGDGPLLLPLPGRPQAVILKPEHVKRVLDETPEPFAAVTAEKHAALVHFQPRGVLISHGAARARRREFNEQVLGSDKPVHGLAARFVAVVAEEADGLLAELAGSQVLTWERFAPVWFRVVRRVVLGDGAREDEALTEQVNQLREAANWAFLHPRRKALREQLHQWLSEYLDRAEPGSLAAVIGATPTDEDTAPTDQVAHWLFAFDPAGMTTFRALALLAAHPEEAEKARAEYRKSEGTARQYLPYIRACILESLRLWPTTPVVLRETTAETQWANGLMPAHTSVVIFSGYFHRDEQRLPQANQFFPELWEADRPGENWPLIPFSSGPGVCPARHLVLLVTSTMLGALSSGHQVELDPPSQLDPREPLPGTLSHFSLRFRLSR